MLICLLESVEAGYLIKLSRAGSKNRLIPWHVVSSPLAPEVLQQ